jgi:hypothetical protein
MDSFELYNILATGDPTANRNLKDKIEEKNSAIQHIENLKIQNRQIDAEIKDNLLRRPILIKKEKDMQRNSELIRAYQDALKIRVTEIRTATQQNEQNLYQFISQKIASTGLPSPKYVSEQPRAYWSWMRSAPWSIPSGFIWPYEREASQVYWDLFQYTQRVAALHSAISEYIKENSLQNGGPSYSLNQSAQAINAVNQFLGNSPACNAQYCIKRLQAQQ